MRYDGYEYHQYPSHNLQSLSLFGLKKDNNGDIFCFNLRGQIFKVKEDSLSVYYDIPDSLLSSEFSIEFNKDNLLFVGGYHPFYLDSNKTPVPIKFPFSSSPYIGRTKEGNIAFSSTAMDTLYIWSHNKYRKLKYPGSKSGDLFYTNSNKYLFFSEGNTYNVYKLDADTITYIPLDIKKNNLILLG